MILVLFEKLSPGSHHGRYICSATLNSSSGSVKRQPNIGAHQPEVKCQPSPDAIQRNWCPRHCGVSGHRNGGGCADGFGGAASGVRGVLGPSLSRWVRRRSWSWRSPAGVMVSPRQPRDARSSTAQAMQAQLVSPGRRPITLARQRVSPTVRSMKLKWRMR